MSSKTKSTKKLAKVTEYGRFEVRFQVEPDGSVLYVTLEKGKVIYSGKLKNWKEAASAWDRLLEKGYIPSSDYE